MSATAWAVICYVVGLIAETLGVIALVKGGMEARKAIKALDSNPTLSVDGNGFDTIASHDEEVRTALGNQTILWWSLVALIIGIAVGFAGNMISTLGTT